MSSEVDGGTTGLRCVRRVGRIGRSGVSGVSGSGETPTPSRTWWPSVVSPGGASGVRQGFARDQRDVVLVQPERRFQIVLHDLVEMVELQIAGDQIRFGDTGEQEALPARQRADHHAVGRILDAQPLARAEIEEADLLCRRIEIRRSPRRLRIRETGYRPCPRRAARPVLPGQDAAEILAQMLVADDAEILDREVGRAGRPCRICMSGPQGLSITGSPSGVMVRIRPCTEALPKSIWSAAGLNPTMSSAPNSAAQVTPPRSLAPVGTGGLEPSLS